VSICPAYQDLQATKKKFNDTGDMISMKEKEAYDALEGGRTLNKELKKKVDMIKKDVEEALNSTRDIQSSDGNQIDLEELKRQLGEHMKALQKNTLAINAAKIDIQNDTREALDAQAEAQRLKGLTAITQNNIDRTILIV